MQDVVVVHGHHRRGFGGARDVRLERERVPGARVHVERGGHRARVLGGSGIARLDVDGDDGAGRDVLELDDVAEVDVLVARGFREVNLRWMGCSVSGSVVGWRDVPQMENIVRAWGGRRVGTYRLERGRHALVELVHLERPGLLLGYVILEANLRRSFGKRGGSAKAVEGAARRGSAKARGKELDEFDSSRHDDESGRAPRRGYRSRSSSRCGTSPSTAPNPPSPAW